MINSIFLAIAFILNKFIDILFSLSPILLGQDKVTILKVYKKSLSKSVNVKIYQPLKKGFLPVIIYYHGGGWIIGSASSYDRVLRHLAYKSQCIVVCPNYRKAPQHQFPTALNDCVLAYKWVLKNIDRYRGDVNKLVLAGDSAGGGLVINVFQKLLTRSLSKSPKLLILFYPLLDVSNKALKIINETKGIFNRLAYMLLIYMKKCYVPSSRSNISSQLSIDGTNLKTLPKTLIITASIDPLNTQINKFKTNLLKAKSKIYYKKYSNSLHGFLNFGAIDKNSNKALDFVSKFIIKNLK